LPLEVVAPTALPLVRIEPQVSQEEPSLEVFTRNLDGSWTLREARNGPVDLLPIACTLAVEDVYRNPLGG
jgi:hypothetical protein